MIFVPVFPTGPESTAYQMLALSLHSAGSHIGVLHQKHQAGLWTVWKGADGDREVYLVLEPNDLGLMLVHLAGEGALEYIEEIQAWLVEYARTNGFSTITMWGRPGWMRQAQKRGWDLKRVMYTLEVDRGRNAD